MSQQLTFADSEFSSKRRQTRKEIFLSRMDNLLPWSQLLEVIDPFYPKAGNGRRPYALETVFRIHCMQQWFSLGDEAMEDALYEIASMRQFAQLSLDKAIPDRTTIMNFRHLLEKHRLGKEIFNTVNKHLDRNGLILREGTIVDATIIDAPSSTKNKKKQRDPDMHQTKKGNEWRHGMKMHIGVDEVSGVIHSIDTTPANKHDITSADKLLHGKEKRVFGDSGYRGIQKRAEHKKRNVDWLIAMQPGKRRHLDEHHPVQKMEKLKASIRAKVEHPFRHIKNVFGYKKVRYRGLAKNTDRLYMLAAFSNLMTSEKYMLA